MNDESVKVWAKSKFDFPELKSFTICTWVKFTFEVNDIYNHEIVIKVTFESSSEEF